MTGCALGSHKDKSKYDRKRLKNEEMIDWKHCVRCNDCEFEGDCTEFPNKQTEDENGSLSIYLYHLCPKCRSENLMHFIPLNPDCGCSYKEGNEINWNHTDPNLIMSMEFNPDRVE